MRWLVVRRSERAWSARSSKQAVGSNVRTQPVQRAIDLTWYTFGAAPRSNHWTPAPDVRTQHVRDLTRWNDQPRRTAPQAEAPLRRSAVAAVSEAAHLQSHERRLLNATAPQATLAAPVIAAPRRRRNVVLAERAAGAQNEGERVWPYR